MVAPWAQRITVTTTRSELLSEGGLWNDDAVSYGYKNRLRTSLNIRQPDADAWAQTYAYDGAGRLTSITTPAGETRMLYDSARKMMVGRLSLPKFAHVTSTCDGVARMLSTTLQNSGNSVLNSHSCHATSAAGAPTKRVYGWEFHQLQLRPDRPVDQRHGQGIGRRDQPVAGAVEIRITMRRTT